MRARRFVLSTVAVALVLTAAPAAANLSLDVSFYSCSVSPSWSAEVANAQQDRFGRLRLFDESGQIVHQQVNVPFTNDACRAQLTIQFTDELLSMLLGNTDPPTSLFIGFEACKSSAEECTFATPENKMEKDPLAEVEPINTVLDEFKGRVDDAVQDLEDRKVNRIGDTMTGDLTVEASVHVTQGSLDVGPDGASVAGGLDVVSGGADVTGGLAVSGGAGVTGGLAVVSGGADVAGGLEVISGGADVTGGLEVVSGGADVTGGLEVLSGGATVVGDPALSVVGDDLLVLQAEVLTERTVVNKCPPGLDAFELAFDGGDHPGPNTRGNVNRLCASQVHDQAALGHTPKSLYGVLKDFVVPMCEAVNLSPFGNPVKVFSPLLAAIYNQLGGTLKNAVNSILAPIQPLVNGFIAAVRPAVNGVISVLNTVNNIIQEIEDDVNAVFPDWGTCSDPTASSSCTDNSMAKLICKLDVAELIDCRTIGFGSFSLPSIVPPSTISNFNLNVENLPFFEVTPGDVEFLLNPFWQDVVTPGGGGVPSTLLALALGKQPGDLQYTGGKLACNNQDNIDAFVDASIEVLKYVPGVPVGVSGVTEFHQYGPAQEYCAAQSAHVCTKTEIFAIVGDGNNAAGVLGYSGGEWVSGELVAYDVASGSDFVFAVPFPPIAVDVTPLLSVPPSPPFSVGLARFPEGKFQCCMSTSVLN